MYLATFDRLPKANLRMVGCNACPKSRSFGRTGVVFLCYLRSRVDARADYMKPAPKKQNIQVAVILGFADNHHRAHLPDTMPSCGKSCPRQDPGRIVSVSVPTSNHGAPRDNRYSPDFTSSLLWLIDHSKDTPDRNLNSPDSCCLTLRIPGSQPLHNLQHRR